MKTKSARQGRVSPGRNVQCIQGDSRCSTKTPCGNRGCRSFKTPSSTEQWWNASRFNRDVSETVSASERRAKVAALRKIVDVLPSAGSGAAAAAAASTANSRASKDQFFSSLFSINLSPIAESPFENPELVDIEWFDNMSEKLSDAESLALEKDDPPQSSSAENRTVFGPVKKSTGATKTNHVVVLDSDETDSDDGELVLVPLDRVKKCPKKPRRDKQRVPKTTPKPITGTFKAVNASPPRTSTASLDMLATVCSLIREARL